MRDLKIEVLRKLFNRIIEKLEFEKIDSIKIEEDLYNKIPTHKWDICNKPEDVVVISSLYDDIDSLSELINDKDRVCTYVDFDRVASILRVVSQLRNPVED